MNIVEPRIHPLLSPWIKISMKTLAVCLIVFSVFVIYGSVNNPSYAGVGLKLSLTARSLANSKTVLTPSRAPTRDAENSEALNLSAAMPTSTPSLQESLTSSTTTITPSPSDTLNTENIGIGAIGTVSEKNGNEVVTTNGNRPDLVQTQDTVTSSPDSISELSSGYFTKEEFKSENAQPLEVQQRDDNNAFEIKADAGTRVLIISATNECRSFYSMTFKVKNAVSGRIFVKEDPDLSIPAENKSAVYSMCSIILEGFSDNDIEDVGLRVIYTDEWVEKNNVHIGNLKVYSNDPGQVHLDQKHDVKVIGESRTNNQTYNILETNFEKMPGAYALVESSPYSTPVKETTAAGIISSSSSKIKAFLGSSSILMGLGMLLAIINRILMRKRYIDITKGKEKPVFW